MIIIDITSVLKVLPVVLEIEKEMVSRGRLGTFIDRFILLINELPTQYKLLIVSDFNLDQMLPEHVGKVDPLLQIFRTFRTSGTF